MKKQILNDIKKYDTIIIHGHKRPDGDCYGAQFGLKDIIKQSFPKKEVYVVGETSEYVNFVGKVDNIPDNKYQGALSIVVDTAVAERISDQRYALGDKVIKIDHHIAIEHFGDYHWVEEESPSCAQMIGEFFMEFSNELKLSKEGAIAMYTGILTDTGQFRYRGVSQKTFQVAGMLVGYGVQVDYIDGELSKTSLEEVALKGYLYTNYKTTKDGFIYIIMTRDVIKKYNVSEEDAAALVNNLAGINGYPVWALFIEYETKEIRIRIRSSGPDVDKLANKYGGGGHAKAAGAKLDSWNQLDEFLHDANEWVSAYKEGLK